MKHVQTFTATAAWSEYCRAVRQAGDSIGFVPTMGALHHGHAELIRRSKRENAYTVISIFVNPTQFNDAEDLKNYPRTYDDDLQLADELGIDAVFFPSDDVMYPDAYAYRVDEVVLSQGMEGLHRPGHFTGVLTVVLKLLLLTQANRAYFGEKDYQQYVLIRRMAEAFFLPAVLGTEVIGCPIVREADGLAMSSRNRRLSAGGRRKAALLPKFLREFKDPKIAAEKLAVEGITIDYIEDTDGLSPGEPRRFAAVYVEGIRLIDTIPLSEVIGGDL